MKKKAIITGISGQDGAYLAKFLLEKGYQVYGGYRRNSDLNTNKLERLGVKESIDFVPIELCEFTNIYRAIEKIRPDEFYNLAAQSFVHLSFEQPLYTSDTTAMGVLRILEAIRTVSPKTKLYQASSSEMYGKVRGTPQNEETPFYPRSPYAAAKLFAHTLTINYRESYGIFAVSGILFNHESPIRGLEFVTRKITNTIAKIKHGKKDALKLGNLDSKRDWGYAKEYVEAMWLMLQQKEPEDFVIATGKNYSVREFTETAFKRIGIEIVWEGKGVDEKGIDKKTGKVVIEVSPEYFRPAEVDCLVGDYSKAKEQLGWEPKTSFKELVSLMVDGDLELV